MVPEGRPRPARRRGLFRTSSFRLALLGAGLAALTTGILFVLVHYSALGAIRTALDLDIRNELAEIAPPGPPPSRQALLAAVRGALAEPHAKMFYALRDRKGALLAGNLAPPPLSPGWHGIRRFKAIPPVPAVRMIRGIALREDGLLLFVGEDATTLTELNELIRRGFAIGLGITLLIGLGAGLAFGRRALARIDQVSSTSREIMEGDLTRRLALTGAGDEFDQLAEAINAMLARIEALMENIRQVGNEIAHDLRSPLSRLRETLELALRSSKPEALPAAIEEAIAQADAALALFAAILRLAQIESGARRASFTIVDLSALLASLAETYEAVAEETGQALTARIAPGLRLRGDEALLTQLFANLIENAIKHCPPGTTITLEAALRQGIAVGVSDNGPGIAGDRRSLVLRRFGRLDASRQTAGHGLGLPLAQAIAELHGASLTLGNAEPGLRVSILFSTS